MRSFASRIVNEQVLRRFNVKVVRASSFREAPSPPAVLRQGHVDGARLFADRSELIKSLAYIRNARVAEVGVAWGDFSRVLIDELKPQCFHAYDLFRLHKRTVIWGKPTREVLGSLKHREFYERRFATEIAEGRVTVFEGDGVTRLQEHSNEFYDIIYIDGNHYYESVLRDAEASARALKHDGYLVFNDYIMYSHLENTPYGVVHVVNNLCVNQGWRITHFAFQQDMFCDVAIQRALAPIEAEVSASRR